MGGWSSPDISFALIYLIYIPPRRYYTWLTVGGFAVYKRHPKRSKLIIAVYKSVTKNISHKLHKKINNLPNSSDSYNGLVLSSVRWQSGLVTHLLVMDQASGPQSLRPLIHLHYNKQDVITPRLTHLIFTTFVIMTSRNINHNITMSIKS